MRTRNLILTIPLLGLCASGCATGGRAGLPSRWRTIASAGEKPAPIEAGPPGRSVTAELEEPETRSRAEGKISGRVVDGRGRPVPNAEVRLADGASRGGRGLSDTTDAAGGFTLKGLRPGGSYTLIAEGDDGQGVLTGRIKATAPSASVRIKLADTDAEVSPGENPNPPARSRVGKVSERESVAADEADAAPASRPVPARVNPDDLPPPEEAETVGSNEDVPPNVARKTARTAWRRGGTSDPAVEMADGSSNSLSRSGRSASPGEHAASRHELADEGPNPLPPAKERPPETAVPVEPSPPPSAEPKSIEPVKVPLNSEPVAPPPADVPTSPPTPSENQPESKPAEQPAEPKPTNPSPPQQEAPAAPAPIDPPPAAEPPAADKPIDSAAIPAETGPKHRPTWAEITEQATTRQHAATLPISTRRPSTSEAAVAAENATAARPRRGLTGLLGGRSREAAADDPKSPVQLASCQFDARKQQIVDFRLPDLDGKPVRFQDLDAEYVLLDFWGTWCQPCRESIPHLVELQTKYGPKTLRVVGVAAENGSSPEQQARNVDAVATKLGVNYSILLSGADGQPCPVQAALHIQAYPTMILLDRAGNILWRGKGAEVSTLARLDRVIAARTDSSVVRR